MKRRNLTKCLSWINSYQRNCISTRLLLSYTLVLVKRRLQMCPISAVVNLSNQDEVAEVWLNLPTLKELSSSMISTLNTRKLNQITRKEQMDILDNKIHKIRKPCMRKTTHRMIHTSKDLENNKTNLIAIASAPLIKSSMIGQKLKALPAAT